MLSCQAKLDFVCSFPSYCDSGPHPNHTGTYSTNILMLTQMSHMDEKKRRGTQCSEQHLILSQFLSLSRFLPVSIDVMALCSPGPGREAQRQC